MQDEDMPANVEKGKNRAVEVLEVEDEEQRHARMHDVFAKLDASSSRPPAATPSVPNPTDPSRAPVEPNTELLSRVQAFLPELAESNSELARRAQGDPSSVDIENVAPEEAYIEMESNLGLGVFEQRRSSSPGSQSATDTDPDSDDDSEAESESAGDSSDSSSGSESQSTDSESSSDEASSDRSPPSNRPIKPLPRRNPKITIVGGGSNDGAT